MTRRSFLVWSAGAASAGAQTFTIETVTGPVAARDLGLTLMHEHVVTDLRAPDERAPHDYDRADAVRSATPHLERARAAGVRTLVEPTPIWIGRDAAALRELSEATGVRIVCATGIYGAAEQRFIPPFAREEAVERLAERYVEEHERGIGRTGVRPGLIKTGVNRETPLPEIERKLVRAAASASRRTGLTTASHSGPAAPVWEQLRILDEVGLPRRSFIWVHAQNEQDPAQRRLLAAEGVWVELDGISERSAERHLEAVKDLAYAGFLDRTLISQDAGWYRPGAERASKYRGYDFLPTRFVAMLREAGFSRAEIDRLLIGNPARALAGA